MVKVFMGMFHKITLRQTYHNASFSILYGEDAKYFEDEIHLQVKHKKKGTVAMANEGKHMNGSRVCTYEMMLF